MRYPTSCRGDMHIQPAENGWLIFIEGRPGDLGERYVAESPEKLAEIVVDLAKRGLKHAEALGE